MRIYSVFFLSTMMQLLSMSCVAMNAQSEVKNNHPPSAASSKEPDRRAKPAPFDDIFPSTDYLGPTIGVADTTPVYPLNAFFWKEIPKLQENNIRLYGWINPSYNVSSSRKSNAPMAYALVADHLELQEVVLRAERVPDTVQLGHIDWGFRVTNLYGIDYRYTTAAGVFSQQLLSSNNLYGYDPIEAYGQLYFPSVAQGMLLTIGRFISPPDIESQLAPFNYLTTHSLMFTFDAATQTGVNAAIKLNDTWTVQLGIVSGDDVTPWVDAATVPTFQALVRWVSLDNNDSLWGGINSLNDGKYRGNHDNLQQFNVSWTHRFTERFFTITELYYLYQWDAAKGGTCNFGAIRLFGDGGGGCGPIIPGRSSAFGAVNFVEFKLFEKNFMSFRTDFLGDYEGQRTGFSTSYMSWTLGLTHVISKAVDIRPEIRYETAFSAIPYNNGTRKNQTVFAVDAIVRF